jgi:hypothetical protein
MSKPRLGGGVMEVHTDFTPTAVSLAPCVPRFSRPAQERGGLTAGPVKFTKFTMFRGFRRREPGRMRHKQTD